jgi:L-amino acid N-acyltransferase YncA
MALKWKKHEILTPPSQEDLSKMQPEKLAELHEIYHQAIANADAALAYCQRGAGAFQRDIMQRGQS